MTEPILMEVLAGVPPYTADRVERLLASQALLGVAPAVDYHAAAQI